MHCVKFNREILNLRAAIIFVSILFFAASHSFSQEKKRVEILRAGALVQSESIANAQRLIDSVIIKHEGILMYCDSAYTYENSNRVDAFGKVHINQGDTLHLYAQKVYYDGDRSFAQAINNVVLENKEITLYTDTLDYDMELNIGYYECSGKIVDSTNTLTSKIGKYFLDTNLANFTDSVVGFSDDFTLNSDDIQYNTETEVIYFKGPTTIKDSANTLYAEDGWYNTITGEADLQTMPHVYNETQSLTARQILYNKENGDGQAIGNARLEDFKNRSIVLGNEVIYNETTELATVTDSAVFISYNETDSLYLHADTLRTMPDTVEGENIIKAHYGVFFYRKDVQGACDSLVYYTKDSLVQLFVDPVIWSDNHQLSAEQINMIQHSNSPDEMLLYKNSFIISQLDSSRFDQIKGKNMVGSVVNDKLDRINVDGNGQTLYYAREDNEIIGINRAESSNISIQFKDGQIHRIAFHKAPEGELKPLLNLGENETKLSDFNWQINRRPRNPKDIFKSDETKQEIKELTQEMIEQ